MGKWNLIENSYRYSLRAILILALTIFINVHYVSAQEDTELNIALTKITNTSLSGNSEDMLELTSPRLIKVMGGKENALKLFKQAYSSLGANGFKIDTVLNYSDVRISEIDNIRYSFFPQLLVMSVPDKDKKMITVTTLLALKEPSTTGWTFIDYNNMSDENLGQILPEFKNKIEFPRGLSKKPLVIPKDEVDQSIKYLMQVIDQSMTQRKEVIGVN